jgi:hypothetical protein
MPFLYQRPELGFIDVSGRGRPIELALFLAFLEGVNTSDSLNMVCAVRVGYMLKQQYI